MGVEHPTPVSTVTISGTVVTISGWSVAPTSASTMITGKQHLRLWEARWNKEFDYELVHSQNSVHLEEGGVTAWFCLSSFCFSPSWPVDIACRLLESGSASELVLQTLGMSNSNNININGLTSLNSQMFHIVINGCNNVKIQGVKVVASGESPNTDGIHVQTSTDVTILNSKIGTGDDCVSIGPGTSNLWIENVSCGPGHGISIGSLGKDLKEAGVENVTVKTSTFKNTQNGLRIKSWGRPSSGFARNILFQHAVMVNVQNPILIDQNYCPNEKGCPGQVSGIKVSDVTYEDIHGTSATEVGVKFDCSSKYPCSKIILKDVKLTYNNQPAQASCTHAATTSSGLLQPTGCL